MEESKNIDNLYYSQNKDRIEPIQKGNIILLIIILLFSIYQGMMISEKVNSFFLRLINWFYVILTIGVIILVIYEFKVSKLILINEVYPVEKQKYYPFDSNVAKIKNMKNYNEVKHNLSLSYADPTYIGHISPLFTHIDYLPKQIRWITYEKYNNLGRIDSVIRFAILPISISSYSGGKIILRIFSENKNKSDVLLPLKYYYSTPTNWSIRNPPILLSNVKIPKNSLGYQDICATNYNQRGQQNVYKFYIINWWTTNVRNSSTKNYHGKLMTVLRILHRYKDEETSQRTAVTYGLLNNPFIAPQGLKSIVIFIETGGNIISESGYKLINNKRYKITKFIIVLLLGMLFIISIYNWIISDLNYLLLVIVYLILIYEYLFKLNNLNEINKNMEKLFSKGLIKNPKYISLNDFKLDHEMDKEWYEFTSMFEKITDFSFPVDYCYPFEDQVNVNRKILQGDLDKVFSYPQYVFRKKSVNLPPLHVNPTVSKELERENIDFNFNFPDRMIEFVRIDNHKSNKLVKDNSFCNNCGNQLFEKIEHCFKCGTKR